MKVHTEMSHDQARAILEILLKAMKEDPIMDHLLKPVTRKLKHDLEKPFR